MRPRHEPDRPQPTAEELAKLERMAGLAKPRRMAPVRATTMRGQLEVGNNLDTVVLQFTLGLFARADGSEQPMEISQYQMPLQTSKEVHKAMGEAIERAEQVVQQAIEAQRNGGGPDGDGEQPDASDTE